MTFKPRVECDWHGCGETVVADEDGEHGWQNKDTAVFPVGYRPLCKFCVAEWRRRTGGV